MARFELAEAAFDDLAAILDYTSRAWGTEQARDYLDWLEARLTELALRPGMGRERQDLERMVRSFPFESHVIYYAQAPFGIQVVRILHQRQDPNRHLS